MAKQTAAVTGGSWLLLPLLLLLFVMMFALLSAPLMAFNGAAKKYGQGSLRTYQCAGECGRRCSRTQYRKPCMFFCQKCCHKCLCVPPGFYANKQLCSCYNDWKTKRGGPKCP